MKNVCIQIKDVNKSFRKKQVLFNMTLDIPRAQIIGILGPSGSGKTTLIKIIAGIDGATTGHVEVLGEQMPKLSVMQHIGYMAQADALYDSLTAEQNLDFFASLYKLPKSKRTQRIQEVLQLVDLEKFAKKQVKQFSGGMKRRLSLAISLIHEPSILILDEPTVGIDPILRKSIWDELRRICDSGVTILVTTHVMGELENCDMLAMIREGKIIATGSPTELKTTANASTMEDAFLYYGGVQ